MWKERKRYINVRFKTKIYIYIIFKCWILEYTIYFNRQDIIGRGGGGIQRIGEVFGLSMRGIAFNILIIERQKK